MEKGGAAVTIKHVKAHTLDNGDTEQQTTATPEARLNQKADDKARQARMDPADPSWIQCPPQPTFFMDEWTIWTKEEGYQEGDTYQWVKNKRLERRREMTRRNNGLLNQSLYRESPLSERQRHYWYTRNPRDYSLRVQALVRGRALPTLRRMEMMYPGQDPQRTYCPHCTTTVEDEHHIFVECSRYEEARRKTAEQLVERMGAESEEHINKIFNDGEWWKGNRSRYYLGFMPKDIPANIAKAAQLSAMQTAGYIWSIRNQLHYERAKNQNREEG